MSRQGKDFESAPIEDEVRLIPLIDCSRCGAKDVPAFSKSIQTKKGCPDISLWVCSNCGQIPYTLRDLKIKQWVTPEELKAAGFEEEEEA